MRVSVLIMSIIAGMLVSIGCVVFLMCPNRIVGSFLFSFALFTILNLKLELYTGRIGYLAKNFKLEYGGELLLTLLGNFLGTFFTALLIRFTRLAALAPVTELTAIKLGDSVVSMFILAIFCGMLMFLAVELFRTVESYLGKVLAVIFSVMVFIHSGFEHCIADMFYFNLAGNLKPGLVLILVLGNSIGALLLCWLLDLANEHAKSATEISSTR